MSTSEVQRVKEDLATLQQAAGLEPLVAREDVWANLVIAAAGVVAVVWALLPHGMPQQWGMVPLVLVVLSYLIWQRARHRQSAGRSAIERKKYSSELAGVILITALALVYRLWATELGISRAIAGGAAFFILGAAIVVFGLRESRRWPELGMAIPIMLCGLAIPLLSVSTWVLLGSTFAVGGAVTAGLTTYQIRMDANAHAAD